MGESDKVILYKIIVRVIYADEEQASSALQKMWWLNGREKQIERTWIK